MALQLEDGKYAKIGSLSIQENKIVIHFYKDKNHRVSGNTEFLRAYGKEYFHDNLWDEILSQECTGKSIKDTIYQYSYTKIKQLDEFRNAVDV